MSRHYLMAPWRQLTSLWSLSPRLCASSRPSRHPRLASRRAACRAAPPGRSLAGCPAARLPCLTCPAARLVWLYRPWLAGWPACAASDERRTSFRGSCAGAWHGFVCGSLSTHRCVILDTGKLQHQRPSRQFEASAWHGDRRRWVFSETRPAPGSSEHRDSGSAHVSSNGTA